MNEKFDNIIRQRIYQRVPISQLSAAGIKNFYVAGNSLNKNAPNDIDIFPVKDFFTRNQASKLGAIVSETRNAITVKVNVDNTLHHQTVDDQNEIKVVGKTMTIQLCNYTHESIEKLVESFDFSHIRIGAEINSNGIVDKVYYSKDYMDAKMCQSTEYIGSEYPLSSLIRAFKYAKRGDFAGNSHIFSVFKVLTDIIHRGFKNYDDFKDQLDAIDLGLVPENKEELSTSGLSETGLDYSADGKDILNKLVNFLSLGKQGICKDAQLSFEYAKTLDDRFEEGEDAISNNPKLAYDYWNILQRAAAKRNEKIERLPELMHNKMLMYAMEKNYYADYYLRSITNYAA
jgi:hypothetical protein